jgi:uncharacterized protein YkwD
MDNKKGNKMKFINKILVASTAAFMLAACGGGSASDTSTTTATTGGGTSTPTPQVDSTCGFANFQAEMLARINANRAAGAVCGGTAFPAASAVSWNGQLQTAATVMATDIARTGSHSHIGSDGSTFGNRIAAAGYGYTFAGENISGGYGSVQAAVDGWMASQVHCENIMKAEFREIGASCVRNGAGETNFALEFGAR